VKFKKKESERSAAYRQLSYGYYKQMSEKEPWIELKVHEKDVCVMLMRARASLAVNRRQSTYSYIPVPSCMHNDDDANGDW
jgi:uncharacterized pyridoxamine 5'-phosphate oxidase family protein